MDGGLEGKRTVGFLTLEEKALYISAVPPTSLHAVTDSDGHHTPNRVEGTLSKAATQWRSVCGRGPIGHGVHAGVRREIRLCE